MVNLSTFSDDHQDELAAIMDAQSDEKNTPVPFLFIDSDLIDLGIVLDFGPEELLHNREGYLTLAQIKRLEIDLRMKYWPLIILMTALAFGYGIGGLIARPGALLILLPTVIMMMMSAVLAFLLKWERENVPNRRVCSTVIEVGRLRLTLRRWGITNRRDIHAQFTGSGGQKLFAPKKLYNTLHANRIYRAYYAPGVSWDHARILSMEPIGERVYPEAKAKVKQKPKRKR